MSKFFSCPSGRRLPMPFAGPLLHTIKNRRNMADYIH